MSTAMRAKFRVSHVRKSEADGKTTGEVVTFNAVAKNDGYPADGVDENNSFARWTPTASCEVHIANPALFGQFEAGQQFYVDFTPAD